VRPSVCGRVCAGDAPGVERVKWNEWCRRRRRPSQTARSYTSSASTTSSPSHQSNPSRLARRARGYTYHCLTRTYTFGSIPRLDEPSLPKRRYRHDGHETRDSSIAWRSEYPSHHAFSHITSTTFAPCALSSSTSRYVTPHLSRVRPRRRGNIHHGEVHIPCSYDIEIYTHRTAASFRRSQNQHPPRKDPVGAAQPRGCQGCRPRRRSLITERSGHSTSSERGTGRTGFDQVPGR
jgi:hypothetical protein